MNIVTSLVLMQYFGLLHVRVYAMARDSITDATPLRRLSSCGALSQECSDEYLYLFDEECCELSTAGIFVWILVWVAVIVGIVACSCACCKCCPWHDRMCCAARRRRNDAPVVVASVKQSHTESSADVIPVKPSVEVVSNMAEQ